jgi:Lar family restriction alleviation protein
MTERIELYKISLMEKPALEMCPFCGEKDQVELAPTTNSFWYVMCLDCGVATENYERPEEAVAAWNRRVQ